MVAQYGVAAMKRKILLVVFFILIFLLIGCFASSPPTSDEIEITATAASTQTTLPSPSLEANVWNYFPNLTPIPTPSISQQADLMHLLKSDICNLPCYLGIEPGKTTFDEAGNIISKLGGILRADYENVYEGYPEKPPLRLSSYIFDVNSLFYINLIVSGKNNQVQQIIFDALGNFQPLFYEAWEKYSIESIFKNYGEADQIFIYKNNNNGAKRYDIRVVYLNYGLIIDWSGLLIGNSTDYKICPKFSKENIHSLQIILDEPQSTFENIPSSYIGFEEMYKSTEEILGISEKEFYDQVVANDSVCFDIKIK